MDVIDDTLMTGICPILRERWDAWVILVITSDFSLSLRFSLRGGSGTCGFISI